MTDKMEQAALRATQAMAIANRVVLCDIVTALARLAADPKEFLDEMADRVIRDARDSVEREEPALQIETEASAEVMFAFVLLRLSTPP